VGESVAADFKDVVGADRVQEMLGPISSVSKELRRKRNCLATGLAGPKSCEVLQIEATLTRPRNRYATRKLGDVMQESAQAALNLHKARAERLSINLDFIRNATCTFIFPRALPKDRPSRNYDGCGNGFSTDARACPQECRHDRRDYSARAGAAHRRLKEKLLAAHRFGIDTISCPRTNEKDLPESRKKCANVLTSTWSKRIDEVIALALEEQPPETAVGVEAEARHLGRPNSPPQGYRPPQSSNVAGQDFSFQTSVRKSPHSH